MNKINIEDLKSLLSMIGLFKETDNGYEYINSLISYVIVVEENKISLTKKRIINGEYISNITIVENVNEYQRFIEYLRHEFRVKLRKYGNS